MRTKPNQLAEDAPTNERAPDSRNAQLIYDGDCPLCGAFVKRARLKRVFSRLQLIDARLAPELVKTYRTRGIEINDGMIFVIGDAVYHGETALAVLANLTTPVNTFNWLSAHLFSSTRRARALYPLMKFGRRLALKLKGRKMID